MATTKATTEQYFHEEILWWDIIDEQVLYFIQLLLIHPRKISILFLWYAIFPTIWQRLPLIQWYCIYWLTGVLRSNTPSSSCMDQKGGKGQTSSSIQLESLARSAFPDALTKVGENFANHMVPIHHRCEPWHCTPCLLLTNLKGLHKCIKIWLHQHKWPKT